MKQIYLLENLDLTLDGLRAEEESVFLQQGSLDGACGPYCLFMALLILGEIESSQATNLKSVKGSSRLGKMIKKLTNFEVLIHNGTTIKDLTDILDHSFKRRVRFNVNSEDRNQALLQFIIDELTENHPVLVIVRNDYFAHWLLAIGYETDENDAVTKLFFLDPSDPLPPNQYWNAVVTTAENYRKKHHHQYLNNDGALILFDDCFSIEKRYPQILHS